MVVIDESDRKILKKPLQEDQLDIDVMEMRKKKKKKKNVDVTPLPPVESPVKPQPVVEIEETVEIPPVHDDTPRHSSYEFLLNRIYDEIRENNPNLIDISKKKFSSKPPKLERVGTKKTRFVNFMEIVKLYKRDYRHMMEFIFSELGNTGSIDGNDALLIRGRFDVKQIENILRKYVKEFILCRTCKSPETELVKEARLFFLQCLTCKSKCAIPNIKTGFQALTSKRSALKQK